MNPETVNETDKSQRLFSRVVPYTVPGTTSAVPGSTSAWYSSRNTGRRLSILSVEQPIAYLPEPRYESLVDLGLNRPSPECGSESQSQFSKSAELGKSSDSEFG